MSYIVILLCFFSQWLICFKQNMKNEGNTWYREYYVSSWFYVLKNKYTELKMHV